MCVIGCGEKGRLLHCWWECKLIQPLWKTVWRLLKKLGINKKHHMTHQSHSQAYILRKTKLKKDTCTPMFIAALFTVARTWKQPRRPSTDGWIKKLWYMYAVEYDSAIKRNTCESVLMRWMKLEPIIQSEVSQKEKHKHRILTHIYGIQKDGTDELIFRAAMEKQTQRTDLWTRWEERREKGRCVERVTQNFTIPYVKQIANGNLLCDSGNSNRGSATG